MKLQIPGIGDVLRLLEPWTFTVIPNVRNAGMYEHLYPDHPKWREAIRQWCWYGYTWNYETRTRQRNHDVKEVVSQVVTLPAGVKLVVDRVYMAKVNTMYRGGNRDVKDFHSLTFIIRKNSNVLGNKKQIRFFVSLADANKIVYDIADTDEEYTGLEKGTAKAIKPKVQPSEPLVV